MKRTGLFLVAAILLWAALTLWAETKGGSKQNIMGAGNTQGLVLIVYDPDPFYNLDEQVCMAMGEVLAKAGYTVTVSTVAAAKDTPATADLFIFCANTYNWRPDWAVTSFIKKTPLQNKKVAAITLGAGSTSASQKALENLLQKSGAVVLASRPYWLWRPNDERRKETNVAVAVSMAQAWAQELGTQLQQSNTGKY